MFGLPELLVSDNGPQFTAEEFGTFLAANGVKHSRSAPYHPATNGLAERFVQSLKQALKASLSSGLSFSHRLNNDISEFSTLYYRCVTQFPLSQERAPYSF